MQFFKTVKNILKNPYINPYQALLRHLNWQLTKALNRFPVDLRLKEGPIVRVNRESVGIGALVNSMGYYDPNNMFWLIDLCKSGVCKVFFDVGANIGVYSLICAFYGSKCLAFEPNPLSYTFLSENINLNQFQNKIIPFQIALGETNGTAHMTNFPGNPMNKITTQGEGIIVSITRGDHFIDTYNLLPDVMKIDVEGYEDKVLEGFGETLSKVMILMIESRKVEMIKRILEEHNFIGPFKMNYKKQSFCLSSLPEWEDWIFINSSLKSEAIDLYFTDLQIDGD